MKTSDLEDNNLFSYDYEIGISSNNTKTDEMRKNYERCLLIVK